MQTKLATTFFLILLTACSQSMLYPSTPAGDALRSYYRDPNKKPDLDYQALYDKKKFPPADRAALERAMLAIIRRDHSERALSVAHLLAEWNPGLAATAPEFRRLLPAIAEGLDVSDADPRVLNHQWSPIISIELLGYMGPEAARPYAGTIARRLNTPVTHPIVAESEECWTRFGLAHLLCFLGTDGVPGLAQALKHPDPFIRQMAMRGIQDTFEPGLERNLDEKTSPWFSPHWLAITRIQLQALAPNLLEDALTADPAAVPRVIEKMPQLFTPEVLEELAKHNVSPKIRAAALEKISREKQTSFPHN